MATSQFRDFCENRKLPCRSKISMWIQRCRPIFMSTSIYQWDLEVLAQILESFVRCSVLMKIGVRSCSDELRRWFWVEIALEFYSGFKYTHENSRMQLTGCQNRKRCPCSIETSKMSILERISTPRVGLVDTIRFVSKFYTKASFHDFPENFDLTWIAVNFRELPRNAGFSGKFCWYHWFLHKILCNLCPWQVCRANLGSTVWIWGSVFL